MSTMPTLASCAKAGRLGLGESSASRIFRRMAWSSVAFNAMPRLVTVAQGAADDMRRPDQDVDAGGAGALQLRGHVARVSDLDLGPRDRRQIIRERRIALQDVGDALFLARFLGDAHRERGRESRAARMEEIKYEENPWNDESTHDRTSPCWSPFSHCKTHAREIDLFGS